MEKKLDPKQLIPHVFLPLQLPGSLENLEGAECELLLKFTDTLTHFLSNYPHLPKEILTTTVLTFNTWAAVQAQEDPDPKLISQCLQELDYGQSFALYIRAQNAGLLISVPHAPPESHINGNGHGDCREREEVYLSTFPASQKSNHITGARRDLAGIFPTTSVTVPRSRILESSIFAKHLSLLTSESLPDAMSTITKAATTAVEVSKVFTFPASDQCHTLAVWSYVIYILSNLL
jgi:hypothetical protein